MSKNVQTPTLKGGNFLRLRGLGWASLITLRFYLDAYRQIAFRITGTGYRKLRNHGVDW